MKLRLLMSAILIAAVSLNGADLDFSEATSILDQLKTALLPLLASLATLAIVVAGYLYITGKGNVGKETLINIVIGGIVIGVASGVGSMLFKG